MEQSCECLLTGSSHHQGYRREHRSARSELKTTPEKPTREFSSPFHISRLCGPSRPAQNPTIAQLPAGIPGSAWLPSQQPTHSNRGTDTPPRQPHPLNPHRDRPAASFNPSYPKWRYAPLRIQPLSLCEGYKGLIIPERAFQDLMAL